MADTPDRSEPVLAVDGLMAELQAGVRGRLAERLRTVGQEEFADQDIFDAVEAILGRALEVRPDGLLLPHLLDDPAALSLDTAIRWRTHRARMGKLLIAVKRSILLPVMRWLFEYSQENFVRQQRLNDMLLACVQTLAVEHARLRREVESLRAGSTAAGQAATPRPEP